MSAMRIAALGRPEVDVRCAVCPVRQRAICAVLCHEMTPALAAAMVHKRFRRHQVIWSDGEEADYFAIVVSGAVKLVKAMPDGREQIVGMLFPSDCLGNLFADEQTSYAEAVSETELCCFARKSFERALEANSNLEHALLEKTMRDLAAARDWLATIGRLSAEERLANFLLTMKERHERIEGRVLHVESGNPLFEIPMSRGDIANCLGLTLETVSRHFSKLKRAGIVSIHEVRTIEVHRPEALYAIAGRPGKGPGDSA